MLCKDKDRAALYKESRRDLLCFHLSDKHTSWGLDKASLVIKGMCWSCIIIFCFSSHVHPLLMVLQLDGFVHRFLAFADCYTKVDAP